MTITVRGQIDSVSYVAAEAVDKNSVVGGIVVIVDPS